MVVDDSFVTRKPIEFTLIVLVIIFILLLPVYFFTKNNNVQSGSEASLITESYDEVKFLFGSESDLSEKDKRDLFKISYENQMIQWTGTLLVCEPLDTIFRVSVDQDGDGNGDVIFTSFTDCTGVVTGSPITYRVKLIDWHTDKFVGKEGEVLS